MVSLFCLTNTERPDLSLKITEIRDGRVPLAQMVHLPSRLRLFPAVYVTKILRSPCPCPSTWYLYMKLAIFLVFWTLRVTVSKRPPPQPLPSLVSTASTGQSFFPTLKFCSKTTFSHANPPEIPFAQWCMQTACRHTNEVLAKQNISYKICGMQNPVVCKIVGSHLEAAVENVAVSVGNITKILLSALGS